MKNILLILAVFAVSACAGGGSQSGDAPALDYVAGLDVSKAEHNDSFLSRLALNYRSFALFNAGPAGDLNTGEIFAHKAIAAFSGELPYPEDPSAWNMGADRQIVGAYNALLEQLKTGAPIAQPELAAEVQAKFDCWVSAAATGLAATAEECRGKFNSNLAVLADSMEGMTDEKLEQIAQRRELIKKQKMEKYAAITQSTLNDGRPIKTISTRSEQSEMKHINDDGRVIVINNINIPENLIRPVPVTQPITFNQKIFHNGEPIGETDEDLEVRAQPRAPEEDPNFVSRDEFINMMLALREELADINGKLARGGRGASKEEQETEITLKIQQIPVESNQTIMEEVFEVKFDFDKFDVSPQYREIIKKLATAANANKNMKISVVGHTDTVGSEAYNYALGGKRADAVRRLLVKYGIPGDQIVSVSSGMKDLKVQTGPGVKNRENRRVRVVKETKPESIDVVTRDANPVQIDVEVDGDPTDVTIE
ncbi:MAG: OmpA family protein [Rickettsiales bacterium]|jgi:outer membrane protein OmpA-like peptidoglycan-associated protein|nr:OmpA family protein [Rickettsiales bacterium]